MQTHLDCYACFMNQALRASRLVTDDPSLQKRVLDLVADRVRTFPLSANPPEMAVFIYQTVKQVCGVEDPYQRLKQEYNRKMLALYPKLSKQVQTSPDPLKTAVKFAIAGNVIDFGSPMNFDLDLTLEECQRASYDVFAYDAFRRDIEASDHILYLGDNAGEIVLDKLLIETLAKPTTFVVRDAPIINDVTLEDAHTVGLTDVAEVVSNGDCAPGTILSRCSSQFRERFQRASMIISKGQGNYETLSTHPKPIYFLLRVKCRVVAKQLNLKKGSAILMRSDANRAQDYPQAAR